MNKIGVVLLVLASFFTLIAPLFRTGYPATHDGENHLARIANYSLALRQGQVPPRWAPSFFAGYGYPVFNFNYPLPNIMSLPFELSGLSIETSLKVVQVLALTLGSVSVYLLLRRRMSKDSSLFGLLAYLLTPFLWTNLYVRGAVGEVLAYAIVPMVLVAIEQVLSKKSWKAMLWLFLCTASFFLSHNIFVLILSPLIVLYAVIRARSRGISLQAFLFSRVGITLAFALCSSSFFWIPALFEKHLVSIDDVGLVTDYLQHSPTIQQLLFSPFSDGLSYRAPVDSISFRIGALAIATTIIAALLLIRPGRYRKVLAGLVLFSIFILYVMTPASGWLWSYLPFGKYIQFPWRLLLVLALVNTVTASIVYESLGRRGKSALLFISFCVLIGVRSHPVQNYIHHDDAYYKSFSETSTVLHENTPKSFLFQPEQLSPAEPSLETGGEVSVLYWNGSARSYTVNSTVDQFIIEPTAYFPGWNVSVDGSEVPLHIETGDGRVRFRIPEGTHTVVTRFTQLTPSRIVGNTLSTLSIASMVVYILAVRKKYVW